MRLLRDLILVEEENETFLVRVWNIVTNGIRVVPVSLKCGLGTNHGRNLNI